MIFSPAWFGVATAPTGFCAAALNRYLSSELQSSHVSPRQTHFCPTMIISRVKGGLFMIGGSVIVFVLDAFLSEESAMQVATLTAIQNLLFLISILLMVIGIYFIISSKPCPACGERVRRSDPDCKYCGWIFKSISQNPRSQNF
jgi:hypothetical protein